MAAAEAARPWRAAEPAVPRVCCFNDNTELALLAALRVLWPRAPHDPVRRQILELLADGEQTSGALCAVIHGATTCPLRGRCALGSRRRRATPPAGRHPPPSSEAD